MVNLSYPHKRKLQIYLIAALLAILCCILVACNSDNSYSVAGENVSEPTHFMAKFMITINNALGGGVAIGYRGEALDAFQYLALTFLNEQKCDFKKVVVDCENYREKRRETLTALALKLAQKALRLQRKIALEPMNPFERRIIHSALADSDIAETTSDGEEPNRYIVIIPKGVELKDQRPLKNGEREPKKDGKKGGRDSRRGDRKDFKGRRDTRERKPREEAPEAPDGRVYRGYFTEQDDFVKPVAQSGPPKFKSFGGKKKF